MLRRSVQDIEQLNLERGAQDLIALLKGVTKARLRFEQFPSHAGILRPLATEQEDHVGPLRRRRRTADYCGGSLSRCNRCQLPVHLLRRFCNGTATVPEVLA